MALLSPAITNRLKQVANVTGIQNEAVKDLLTVFDPQNKNLFEILLAPSNLSFSTAGWAALDTTIMTLHCQSISAPLFSVKYDRFNHEQAAVDLDYPDNVTITFIENELSFVRLYLQKWMSETVNMRYYSGIPGDYYFKDNQNAAKKTALVMPMTGMNIPSPCWLKLEGLRFASTEDWSFAQTDTDPMIISVTCAVDNVRLFSPATPFL
jgi:hypothetical protein